MFERFSKERRDWTLGWVLLGMAVLSLCGCSDGRPERVPVSGKVTIDGQPLTSGFVRLVPDDARPSVGRIQEDGSFTLTTFTKKDGSVPGTHRVAVVAYDEANPSQLRWLVPRKYSHAKTSDLTVDIDGPTDALEIELTWGDEDPEQAIEQYESAGDFDPSAIVEE